MGEAVEGLGEAGAKGRRGHAVTRIAVARAGNRQIDGEEQHRTRRLTGAAQELGHEAAVPDHIELEPGRGGGAGHLLDGADAHGGKAEGHAGGLSGLRRLRLTPARVHARKANRGERHRHCQILAEQPGLHGKLGDVSQHPLAQAHGLQVGDIGGQGGLAIGAAVNIVEEDLGQASPGGVAIVGDAGWPHATGSRARRWAMVLAGAPWTAGRGPSRAALARVTARGSSSNRAAS